MEGRGGLEEQEEPPGASRRDPDLEVQVAGEENQTKQLQETPLTEKRKSFGMECEVTATAEERLVVKRRRSCTGERSSFWRRSMMSGGCLGLRAWERTS